MAQERWHKFKKNHSSLKERISIHMVLFVRLVDGPTYEYVCSINQNVVTSSSFPFGVRMGGTKGRCSRNYWGSFQIWLVDGQPNVEGINFYERIKRNYFI